MKKIVIIVIGLLTIVACNNKPKDYVTLSGKIENKLDTVLYVNAQQYGKKIKVNDDGTFKDTLKINEGFYLLTNGMARTVVKLKNGYNLIINFDANNILETAKFSGEGSKTNNYMADKMKLQKEYDFDNMNSYFEVDKPEFDKKVEKLKKAMADLLDKADGLDSTFTSNEIKSNEQFVNFLTSNYDARHTVLAPISKGKPSPKFNFPDINGKNISLDDLKGSYVYIDVWATWCTPCLREIPYLKELEKDYHDKNIKFVSISIDKPDVKDKWEHMVKEKNLSGIQLFADDLPNSEFIKTFNITQIPRFLIIDPDGNIFSSDALRPSDPKLKKLFDEELKL